MSFERRVAACVVLLLSLMPLAVHFLPEVPAQMLLAGVVVAAGGAATALPSDRRVQWATASFGALMILAITVFSLPARTPVMGAIVPIAALCVGAPAWLTLLGVIAGVGVATLLGEPSTSATFVDWFGLVVALGWVGAAAVFHGKAVLATLLSRDVVETHRALVAELEQDHAALDAVLASLADGSLSPMVLGSGLSEDGLALATRVDGDRILLGYIPGPPLASLTAGWALRAAAVAGERDPQALLHMASVELDEVLEGGVVSWLGIFDPTHNALMFADEHGQLSTLRTPSVVVGRAGPGDVSGRSVDTAAISDLFAVPPPFDKAVGANWPAVVSVSLGAACVIAGFILDDGKNFAAAGGLAVAWMASLHGRLRRRAARTRQLRARDAIEEVIDCSDDIHFSLARLHGGLLAYQVSAGPFLATAHRLRGEVLDGTFADVFVDGERRLRVLAGEVVGEGIAPRFLGLFARVVGRHAVSHGAPFEQVHRRVEAAVGREAQALGYPAKLELGLATVTRDGVGRGEGALDKIVRSSGKSAELVTAARLEEGARLYFSPATSRPGPEDDSPRLEPEAAGARLREILAGPDFDPDTGTLASLFALVFDGSHAPRHGTLVELSRSDAETAKQSQAA